MNNEKQQTNQDEKDNNDINLYTAVFNLFSDQGAEFNANQVTKNIVNDEQDQSYIFQNNINDNNRYEEECLANMSSIKDGCNQTKRIVDALKYYESLNIVSNEKDKLKLVKYFHETYKSLLDDYIHIVVEHNNRNDLDQIYDLLATNCNIQHCLVCVRHFRNRNNDKYVQQDQELIFYGDILDTVHCYLLHLYDTALRVRVDSATDEEYNNDNNVDDSASFIDNKFSSICDEIYKQTEKLKQVDGFNNDAFEKQKFDVKPQNQNDAMFMDGFCAFVSKHINIPKIRVQKIIDLLKEEEYDTDVIHMDINCNDAEDNGKESNIGHYTNNKQCYDSIKKYMLNMKLQEYTFSNGYRFYYWNYYKYKRAQLYDDISVDSFDEDEIFEVNGEENEMFVKAKYSSIKEEILSNKIYSLKQHEYNISANKVYKYIHTKQRQETKIYTTVEYLHYDIEIGTVFSFEHLLSIVLYCDWSDLCSAFSATFRRKNPYESLFEVKTRNECFAQWSKLLREAVECFGYTFGDDIAGPFFCGMSFVMVMPEFHIRLCAPTSTSRQLEVSKRFAAEAGIIIQLNNNAYDDIELTMFACSWLSNYPGEDEYLFIGGFERIRIESVRIVHTKENFEQLFSCLFDFNCMLDGSQPNLLYEPEFTDGDCLILEKLINHKLKLNGFKNTYGKYMNNTFDAFIYHRNAIIVNLEFIDEYFGKMSELIFHPLASIDTAEKRQQKLPIVPQKLGLTNLFKPILLDIFENVCDIIISTTSTSARELLIYPFDLLSLLNNIYSSSLWTTNDLKITIKAHCYREYVSIEEEESVDEQQSWIYDTFSTSIASAYQNKNLKAYIINTTDETGSNEHHLIITK